MTHPAILPDARRPGLECSQEADVFDHRRAACLRPARSVDALGIGTRARSSRSEFDGRRSSLSVDRWIGANPLQALMGSFLNARGNMHLDADREQSERAERCSRPATGWSPPDSRSRAPAAISSSLLSGHGERKVHGEGSLAGVWLGAA